jgi:hypothetical protein
MNGHGHAREACLAVLAVLVCGVLGLATPPGAIAEACPNAQFRSGPSERLPDCRAYEQVSPVEKGGLDAVTLEPMLPAQSSACEAGEQCTIAYMNVGAAFGGAPGNEFANAYLAARGPDGWQTTPLSPPTPQAPVNSRANVNYAFSSNLSQAVLRVPLQQLTENAPSGAYNLFLRDASGGYSLVTASAPPEPPRTGCGSCFESEDVPAFAGASADFSHVIFEANDSLIPEAPGGGVDNLYESAAEHVRLVGILPDERPASHGAEAGGGIEVPGEERTRELDHAISEDGSQIVFQAVADNGGPDPAQEGITELYDRIDGSETIELSAPAAGAEPAGCETGGKACNAEPAKFWAASADGALVYFTSKAALTKESNTGPELPPGPGANPGDDLYRYDVDTHTLTDLTVDTNDPDGADVLGVAGASADGSYVYFVATGELAAGASSGEPNLYVWHETAEGGTVRFIAPLAAPSEKELLNVEEAIAGQAFPYHSDVADWTSRPTESQAYVTPDGRHLAFMSVEPLTGYENKADHEVFEYSAETGQLSCASCDANDVPPLGSAFIGAALTERASTPFYQPRALSDDGSRLFFSSPDPLVNGLSGGTDKVFEYENGAVQLISGPEDGGSAVFLDASASGNDVFFATRERLVSTDKDELVDVYDARVDGGLAVPPVVAHCEDGACQEPFGSPPSFPTPASASFAAPASASFAGTGNRVSPLPAKPTRKQLLARALAGCRKLKSRKKRAACIAAANRHYGSRAKGARRTGAKRRRSGG